MSVEVLRAAVMNDYRVIPYVIVIILLGIFASVNTAAYAHLMIGGFILMLVVGVVIATSAINEHFENRRRDKAGYDRTHPDEVAAAKEADEKPYNERLATSGFLKSVEEKRKKAVTKEALYNEWLATSTASGWLKSIKAKREAIARLRHKRH